MARVEAQNLVVKPANRVRPPLAIPSGFAGAVVLRCYEQQRIGHGNSALNWTTLVGIRLQGPDGHGKKTHR
jgi:hypothetical protein